MNRMWKAGIALVALAILAATAVGFVAAQTDGDVPVGDRMNDFLGRLAGNLGVTQEELEGAIDQTQLEMIDEKLADGTIDEEQAARAREAVESGERPFSFGKHRRGGHQNGGRHIVGEVAELTRLEPEAVLEAWTGGKTLVQIAGDDGVSEDELTAALMARVEECVAKALESGKIDQAKADEKLANAGEKINELINSEGPPEGGHKFRNGGSFRGRFGPNPSEDLPTTETSGLTF